MTLALEHSRWSLDDIVFSDIDVNAVRSDEFLFVTLASASFVEILAQTYSTNLTQHFRGNPEITNWLEAHWRPEEVQHGKALKAYVMAVWPEFDWDGGHARFSDDYANCCTVEKLEPQLALELIARCVVETGTSSFYRAIHDYVREPVLRDLINKIKMDEAAHYSFFRRHFAEFNVKEHHSTFAVVATIWRRMRDVRGEDAYIAFKHVHTTRNPFVPISSSHWRDYSKQAKALARHFYPYDMAIQMLVKPIPMAEQLKRPLQWFLVGVAMLATRF